ncbi:transporter substrate-binding domain-containing protein [Gaiella sp.]|uniref:substrate-binding periplasmic protein n=1 Tax=Gaiella sp. TaxID=2663207 RepID=UPI003265D452
MKRIILATIGVALVSAVLATWGLAQSTAAESAASPAAAKATIPKLPALPSEVRSRKRWLIGVKCDFPPFGFIDVQGKNGGYDVEVARRFATLGFGRPNRVSLTCVTTPSRIPTLESKRVDVIISTLTWTAARAQQIDFSIPYYAATGRLLVKNESSVTSTADLAGKTVVTTRGALYATWMRNCFKSTKILEVDGTAAAVLAVKNGQAEAFMFDDAFVLGVATLDNSLKLTSDKFLAVPWGIGIRKGDTETARWVNAAIRRMRAKDEFAAILRRNAPARFVPGFLDNVPRPGNAFAYPVGKDPTASCT